MLNRKWVKWLAWMIVAFGLAWLSTYPAFSGHMVDVSADGRIHLARIESIYDSLKMMHQPGLVSFVGLNQIGAIVNAMYPYLTLLMFVVPKLIIADNVIALMIGFIILNAVTILTAYLLMRHFTKSEWLRWLGVIVYQFNAYHFFVLYSRMAMGEAFGYAFMPLIVLGMLQIWQHQRYGWLTLAVGMSLLTNSHVLSLMLGFVVVVVMQMVRYLKKKFSGRELLDLIKAGVLTVGLSLYSLDNIISTMLSQPLRAPFQAIKALSLNDSWNAMLTNSFAEHATLWNIGLVETGLLLGLGLFLFLTPKPYRNPWILVAIVILVGSSTLIPWNANSTMPGISTIQFLGRLLVFVALFLAIGTVSHFEQQGLPSLKTIGVLMVLIIAVPLFGISSFHESTMAENGTYHEKVTAKNYEKVLQNDSPLSDYWPVVKSGDNESPLVLDANEFNVVDATGQSLTLAKQAKKAEQVQLPVARYKRIDYQLSVNGQTQLMHGKYQLTAQLKKGLNTIKVSAGVSVREHVTMVITIGLWLLLVVFGVYRLVKK